MTYRLKTAIGHFLILFVMYKLSFLNKYIPSDFPKNYYSIPTSYGSPSHLCKSYITWLYHFITKLLFSLQCPLVSQAFLYI